MEVWGAAAATARTSKLYSAAMASLPEIQELNTAIDNLDRSQQQRRKDLEIATNGLTQYLNVVFVALGVLYGAVLQGSNVKCKLLWSPVLLTTALICMCCWVTWNKMHYIQQRQQRVQWRHFQLQQHRQRLVDLQPPAGAAAPLQPTQLPQDPGLRQDVSPAAVAAVFGLLTLLAVLIASYVQALCLS